jgi:hypothetical protein
MLVERGYSMPQSLGRDGLASGSRQIACGGTMRNYLIVMVATMCLGISLAATVRAQDVDWRAQERQLKALQKQERNALKVQQRTLKQSLKNPQVSGVTRTQAKHQMQRDHRNLIEKQKDALQNLKDQEKAYKEYRRTTGR